jgi:hypothetical protein
MDLGSYRHTASTSDDIRTQCSSSIASVEQYAAQANESEMPASEGEDSFVETSFGDGPLGVTLRRNADTGIVFIFDIVSDSQAVNIDVQPGDELWSVGEFEIGNTPLDRDAWKGLIGYIKESARPLKMIWLRRPHTNRRPVNAHEHQPSPVKEVIDSKEVHSADFRELEKVISRLSFKDKEQSASMLSVSAPRRNTLTDDSASSMLLQEGRRLLRQGELIVSSKASKWAKPANKRIILLNDVLIVASPQSGNIYNVENIIELPTCKIRSLGQVFGGKLSSNDHTLAGTVALDSSFELLWPGGELELMADSREVKEVWVLNIYLAICECVESENKVLGWRHQYMLGTMHSSVLNRDESRLRELVGYCEAGMLDYLAIDAIDEDGYTPLHYACMLRMHNMVKILHEATADVTATDHRGFTALHWSALQLDDVSLAMLCSHVFDLDLLDGQGRSPLVLACTEGRSITGKLCPKRLKECIKVMITHQPDINYKNSMGESLVHFLAGSWQFEAVELLLNNGFEDINVVEMGYSMSPLHYAALGDLIKAPIGEASRIMNLPGLSVSSNDEPSDEEPTGADGINTLRALLKAGVKMNMKDSLGRSPLAILLNPAQADKWDQEDLKAAIAVMISLGCRVDDANIASIKTRFPDLIVSLLVEKWTLLPPIECAKLDIKLDFQIAVSSLCLIS